MTIIYEGRKFVFEQFSLFEGCWIDSDQSTFDSFVVSHRECYSRSYVSGWQVFDPLPGYDFLGTFRIRPERSLLLEV